MEEELSLADEQIKKRKLEMEAQLKSDSGKLVVCLVGTNSEPKLTAN